MRPGRSPFGVEINLSCPSFFDTGSLFFDKPPPSLSTSESDLKGRTGLGRKRRKNEEVSTFNKYYHSLATYYQNWSPHVFYGDTKGKSPHRHTFAAVQAVQF